MIPVTVEQLKRMSPEEWADWKRDNLPAYDKEKWQRAFNRVVTTYRLDPMKGNTMADAIAPPEPNIHDYPWLEEATGVDPNKLGAVMLPVRFRDGTLELGYEIGALLPEDLHTTENPARFWIKGDVTEGAHVTLLYGLLTPAYEQADTIYRLLQGWNRPAWLPITGYVAFPSPFDDEKYACIVAIVSDSPDGALAQAHARLEYLPHVNTFQTWKLHATVAYVEVDAAERWLSYLNSRRSAVVEVPATDGMRPSLDLGSAK